MRIAFLTGVPEHAPWAESIRAHAQRLDATVVLTGGADWPGYDAVRLEDLDREFDVACAFGWRACLEIFTPRARAHAYVVPALEDGLLWAGDEMRLLATMTYDLPVHLIAESEAAATALRERTGKEPSIVTPGVRKEAFTAQSPKSKEQSPTSNSLLVVDAQPEFAQAVIERLTAHYDISFLPGLHGDEGEFEAGRTVDGTEAADRAKAYAEAAVLLELPRAEAPLRAALEAMHAGVPAVVTPCLGHDEWVADGESALVVDWDDAPGAARALDRLAGDADLRDKLAAGAARRAADWPSDAQASDALRAALERAVGEGPGSDWPRRLTLNARAAVEGVKRERHSLEVALRRKEGELVTQGPAIRVGNVLKPLWRPLIPLIRLLRR